MFVWKKNICMKEKYMYARKIYICVKKYICKDLLYSSFFVCCDLVRNCVACDLIFPRAFRISYLNPKSNGGEFPREFRASRTSVLLRTPNSWLIDKVYKAAAGETPIYIRKSRSKYAMILKVKFLGSGFVEIIQTKKTILRLAAFSDTQHVVHQVVKDFNMIGCNIVIWVCSNGNEMYMTKLVRHLVQDFRKHLISFTSLDYVRCKLIIHRLYQWNRHLHFSWKNTSCVFQHPVDVFGDLFVFVALEKVTNLCCCFSPKVSFRNRDVVIIQNDGRTRRCVVAVDFR